jgi:hypothetical protein
MKEQKLSLKGVYESFDDAHITIYDNYQSSIPRGDKGIQIRDGGMSSH